MSLGVAAGVTGEMIKYVGETARKWMINVRDEEVPVECCIAVLLTLYTRKKVVGMNMEIIKGLTY